MLVSAASKHAPELVELGLEQREARTGRQPSSRLPPSASPKEQVGGSLLSNTNISGTPPPQCALRLLLDTSLPAASSRQATQSARPARRATQATPCRGRGDNPTATLTPKRAKLRYRNFATS